MTLKGLKYLFIISMCFIAPNIQAYEIDVRNVEPNAQHQAITNVVPGNTDIRVLLPAGQYELNIKVGPQQRVDIGKILSPSYLITSNGEEHAFLPMEHAEEQDGNRGYWVLINVDSAQQTEVTFNLLSHASIEACIAIRLFAPQWSCVLL